ncbi:MAG TPA: restriction endonuclease subunit S [Beijerinckiaceae bacterium]|jgi:type I restriction enzyme S subunit|nr:restriction endonuclease subunit S [Beijerinckiaceae bacterium]
MTWQNAILGDCVDILSGYAFKSDRFNDEGRGLPLVRIRDVVSGQSDTFYDGPYEDRYLVSDGDVLIGMDGEFNRAQWRGGRSLLNQRVCKISSSNGRLSERYLFHILPQILKRIEDQTPFVTVKHLSAKDLRQTELLLPPIEEQHRIAAILDSASIVRSKLIQLRGLAEELLKSAFLTLFGDPGTNPKNWPIGTIRDLLNDAKYGTAQKANASSGKYPMLRMGNLTYAGRIETTDLKFVDLADSDLEKYSLRRGDLLFNRTNSPELVGKTAVFDLEGVYVYAGYLIRARVRDDMADPYYLSHFLNSDYGKKTLREMCKSIIGMANINAQELQNIRVPIPPVNTQRQFRRIVEQVEAMRGKADRQLFDAENLFSSLSQRAFNGQLRGA